MQGRRDDTQGLRGLDPLTRRRFLQQAGAVGLTVAGAGLLAACGSSSDGDAAPAEPPAATPPAPAPAVPAAPAPSVPAPAVPAAPPPPAVPAAPPAPAAGTPTSGGIASVALSIFSPEGSLDPARATWDFDLIAGGILYDNLVKLDASFTPQPALAESWEVSPDAKVWTFRLRDGVTFHDGATLTADDVAWTLNRVLDPATASPAQTALEIGLDRAGIKVMDPRTIRLTLKVPDAFFGVVLGGYNLRITKNGVTDVGTGAIGTGPYKLVEFTPGSSFVVERNPNYWQSGLPYLDGIRVAAIPEEAAKVQAVLSGDVDVADSIGIATAQQVEQADGAQLYSLKNAAFNVIAFDQTTDPYTDAKVRKALKMAIDREALVNVVLQGRGIPGEDIPIPPDDALYPAGFEPLPYDPEQAKALIKEAGYDNGVDVELFTSDSGAYKLQSSVAWADLVRDAGVNVKLNQVQPATFDSEVYLQKPCYASFWFRQHLSTVLSQACVTNGVWNESKYTNTQFDQLVRDAQATPDAAKQKELYAQALPLVAEESGWSVLMWGERNWPAKQRLKGMTLDLINNADFTAAYIES